MKHHCLWLVALAPHHGDVRVVVQEARASGRPNIVVRRRWYDDEYGQGYVELEVDGKLHRFKVYRNPRVEAS